MSWFDGKRTYILAAIMALVNFVCVMGWFCFTAQQLIAFDGMLLAITLIFMRSSVARVQSTVDTVQDTVDTQ